MGSTEADVATSNTISTRLPTQDVFLFALNRTCSHVLCRLLSDQPGWTQSNYHFKRAFDFARESFNWDSISSVSENHRRGFEKLLQEGFNEIQTERNLALAELYDWFLYNGSSTSKPIVVDADDILENGPTIKNLCVSIGMDETKILYKWDTIQAPENAGRRELDFMSGYWSSTSVDSSKSSRGIDLETVYARWEKDFDATVANELRRIVENSMADYNYLKDKKT
ncbi:hypothetical protein ACLX1H_003139 [Fusarium chlamydosporum]